MKHPVVRPLRCPSIPEVWGAVGESGKNLIRPRHAEGRPNATAQRLGERV